MSLVVPTVRELEALGPTDRWDLEDALDTAQGALRAFNDDELRRWVEAEGKTQAEIAQLVGRTQQAISLRCERLGLRSQSNRGRPRNTSTCNSGPASKRGRPRIVRPHNSSAPDAGESDDGEVVDGEVVEDDQPESVSQTVEPSAPADPPKDFDRLRPGALFGLQQALDAADRFRGYWKGDTDRPFRNGEIKQLQERVQGAMRLLQRAQSALEKEAERASR